MLEDGGLTKKGDSGDDNDGPSDMRSMHHHHHHDSQVWTQKPRGSPVYSCHASTSAPFFRLSTNLVLNQTNANMWCIDTDRTPIANGHRIPPRSRWPQRNRTWRRLARSKCRKCIRGIYPFVLAHLVLQGSKYRPTSSFERRCFRFLLKPLVLAHLNADMKMWFCFDASARIPGCFYVRSYAINVDIYSRHLLIWTLHELAFPRKSWQFAGFSFHFFDFWNARTCDLTQHGKWKWLIYSFSIINPCVRWCEKHRIGPFVTYH